MIWILPKVIRAVKRIKNCRRLNAGRRHLVDVIILPEDLLSLTEKIAENVHYAWVVGRISEDWTYGEKRDDIFKTDALFC